jgi:hypothetical protein
MPRLPGTTMKWSTGVHVLISLPGCVHALQQPVREVWIDDFWSLWLLNCFWRGAVVSGQSLSFGSANDGAHRCVIYFWCHDQMLWGEGGADERRNQLTKRWCCRRGIVMNPQSNYATLPTTKDTSVRWNTQQLSDFNASLAASLKASTVHTLREESRAVAAGHGVIKCPGIFDAQLAWHGLFRAEI